MLADALVQVRLATAIAHVVPGATLRIQLSTRDVLHVARDENADLDPCQLRNLVIDSQTSERLASQLAGVRSLELGGSITPVGSGLLARTYEGRSERLFATLLSTQEVGDLLENLEVDGLDDDEMRAAMCSDPALSVTVIAVSSSSPASAHLLDDVAVASFAACAAHELIASTTQTSLPTNDNEEEHR